MHRARLVLGLGIVAAVGVGLSTTRTTGQQPGGGDANHRKITVTGTATVVVKPDTARVSFAVRGSGNDLKAAVAECDKAGAEVEKALKGLKLQGLEIKKGPINMLNSNRFGGGGWGPGGPGGPPPGGGGPGGLADGGPPMGGIGQPFPGGGPPGFGFAEVTRTFTVVASGLGDKDIVAVADKILTAAVAAGGTEPPVFNNDQGLYRGRFGGGGFNGNSNSRIDLYRADVARLRQDALKLAVADAVANAKAAAGVANLTAKDIVTITDQNQYGGPFGNLGMPSDTGRGEVLGEMELIVQVSVTFSY